MDSDLGAIRRELDAIVKEVERITGLKSRWNGSVEFSDELDFAGEPAFRAKKEFGCSILVHRATYNDPNRILTLIHEAMHSVSVGITRPAFSQYSGYEEGIVERVTRLHAEGIAHSLGLSVSLETRDSFDSEIAFLEHIRRATRRSVEDFYLELLRIPLAEREATMVQWAVSANPMEEPIRVLARIATAMRGLRR